MFTSVQGGKAQLLKEARDQALAGDDEPIPVPQRSWFLHAMAQSDPAELLRLQAGNYRHILDRSARLERALVTGAATDPGLLELYLTAKMQRHFGCLMVADRLAELGALGPTQTPADVADAIYALASPDVYVLLIEDRQWSPDRYEAWLALELQRTVEIATWGPISGVSPP